MNWAWFPYTIRAEHTKCARFPYSSRHEHTHLVRFPYSMHDINGLTVYVRRINGVHVSIFGNTFFHYIYANQTSAAKIVYDTNRVPRIADPPQQRKNKKMRFSEKLKNKKKNFVFNKANFTQTQNKKKYFARPPETPQKHIFFGFLGYFTVARRRTVPPHISSFYSHPLSVARANLPRWPHSRHGRPWRGRHPAPPCRHPAWNAASVGAPTVLALGSGNT